MSLFLIKANLPIQCGREQIYQCLHRDSANDKQGFNCTLEGFQHVHQGKCTTLLPSNNWHVTFTKNEKKKKKICKSRGSTLIDIER